MEKKLIAGGAVASLVFAGALVSTVSAQSVADATGLTEEQVIEIALLEVPGEVQEVELEQEEGMSVFEVEILSGDGQEFEIEVNADTGDVLEVSAEDQDDEDEDEDEEGDGDSDDA